ncbi:Annexin [Theobroma cacao]|uniref:Annexin n=1 Tax=Theobroma cacao TaxID=3641 RepID=A0A061FSR1_THECC|nr:Annexin [Theobroma cacao]
MKSFKKLFTSKSKTHSPASSFKIGGMGSLKVLDVIPSPEDDSEKLKKAFQGLGTDEDEIIMILGHRDASQRKQIRETYQQLYNESLIDALNSELSGDFRTAVILWTYDPSERDARLANGALKSKKKGVKQLEIIVEMSCASSPQHLVAVRQAYCSLFDCSLEEAIAASVSMPLKKVLLGLVTSYRYDKELVDMDVANLEADRLHEAIKTKELAHDDVVYILSTRNFHQLRTTFECYRKKYGNPIDKDIMKSGKGDLESLLRMVILCIDSPEKHFAEVVGTSIIGLGTDEDSLTRAIVTRAEIDMMKVRGEYFNIYKSNLDDAVIGDTSGDYRKFLVTLLGGKM